MKYTFTVDLPSTIYTISYDYAGLHVEFSEADVSNLVSNFGDVSYGMFSMLYWMMCTVALKTADNQKHKSAVVKFRNMDSAIAIVDELHLRVSIVVNLLVCYPNVFSFFKGEEFEWHFHQSPQEQ